MRRMWLAGLVLGAAAACGPGEEADTPGEPIAAAGAHEHAVARLDVSVEGNRAHIALHAPAQGIYGFERAPRTDEERAQRQEALRTLEARLAEIVRFDERLQCSIGAAQVSDAAHGHHHDATGDHAHDHDADQQHGHDHGHQHGDQQAHQHRHDDPDYQPDPSHHADEHLEVAAEYEVTCAAPLAGTRLRIDLGLVFPALERVDLRLVSEERQVGVRLPSVGSTTRM
jgi:hypothetical protein